MKSLTSFFFHRLLGWKFHGDFPDLKKCVVIVVPHTHWMDFFIGLMVRKLIGVQINYVGKKSLFEGPFGWFFRWTGGAPVDRSKRSDTVDAVASLFEDREEFRLALAPEGTRKKVAQWKTGYYYIAQKAGVPIILVAFDYGTKTVRISEPRLPSGDYESDYKGYREFYQGVVGKIPAYT
ncbi:MAG: acyltransferase [Bacteroidetes bacterium]|jgi:1-acyl-sn-glycerol-3-phosphate acyltransferase|nr:MAG: acyltransferase [Bacteroidota bacterium]UCE68459.1 MAG: lysophospholipid acyltransferase family protein [Flavobacteriaceae bacterium]